jgi:peptidoglycan/LPS O-acetylase OafA/YrhL
MSADLQTVQQVSEPSTRNQHLDYLDGLRAFAALFVVLHHAYYQSWPTFLYPDSGPGKQESILFGWLGYGHFSVTFFIALSGFCLMMPVLRTGSLRGGAKGFAMGRIRRILPPYYAALLLSIVIAAAFLRVRTHTMYDLSLPLTARGILGHIFLIQNLQKPPDPYQINGPLWSVASESQIYALFPLLVWIWMRKGIAPVLALTFVLAVSFDVLAGFKFIAMLNPEFVFIFAIGMFAAIRAFRDTKQPTKNRDWKFKLLVLIAAIMILRALWLIPGDVSNGPVSNIVVGVASALILIAATRNEGSVVRRVANFPPIVWIGGFSYSLYLLHFPLQLLIWQLFVQPYHLSKLTGFLIVAGPGTATILLISFAFYRVFEKPFMRSKPRA